MINKELPLNQQSVRGRGKYAGKIVKRNKQPTLRETAQYTAKVASRAVADPEVLEQLQEADDFETQLENMILAEMMGKPIKRRQTVAVRSQEEQY